MLYALSLVFSNAGKNRWLRIEGIFMLIIGGASVYLFTLALSPEANQSTILISQLNKWIALAGSFVPVPLMFLFYNELKSLKIDEGVSNGNKPWWRPVSLAFLIA
jgi:hypothetical protein